MTKLILAGSGCLAISIYKMEQRESMLPCSVRRGEIINSLPGSCHINKVAVVLISYHLIEDFCMLEK